MLGNGYAAGESPAQRLHQPSRRIVRGLSHYEIAYESFSDFSGYEGFKLICSLLGRAANC
jgi:hypothetical protein